MSYEELSVWEESHKLALKIYKLTKDFPKDERFRLVDQICRAAASVPTNIKDLDYLNKITYSDLKEKYNKVGKMLNRLISSIRTTTKNQ